MQIRYRNKLNHLVALQKFVLRNTEAGKRMMFHRFVVIEMILVFIFGLFAFNHNPFKVFLVFLGVSSVAWLFRERTVLVQFRRDFKRELRKDKEGLFDKDRILRIDDEGLQVSVGLNDTAYTWDEVELTGKDRKYIYIVLTGLLHYVVPLTALEGENEAEHFMEALEAYRAS